MKRQKRYHLTKQEADAIKVCLEYFVITMEKNMEELSDRELFQLCYIRDLWHKLRFYKWEED